MDALVTDAARALAAFDPLAALRRIALRDDPPALALRGIAMAQLGEFVSSRKLLRRAARAFETSDPIASARCLAAEGEVALAGHDLVRAGRALEAAAKRLDALGDRDNALFARLQLIRRQVLLGELAEALDALDALELARGPERHRAVAEL